MTLIGSIDEDDGTEMLVTIAEMFTQSIFETFESGKKVCELSTTIDKLGLSEHDMRVIADTTIVLANKYSNKKVYGTAIDDSTTIYTYDKDAVDDNIKSDLVGVSEAKDRLYNANYNSGDDL